METTKSEIAEYTAADVAAHKNDDDLWIIIHGEVFDVTKYLNDHPGGADIMSEIAGGDGSEAFDGAGHSDDALDIKEEFRVGRLKGETLKRTPKAVRLITQAVTASSPQGKEQGHKILSACIALSIGLSIAFAGLGLWWTASRTNILSVPNLESFGTEWPWQAIVERKGLGFLEGVLLTSVAFVLTIVIAVKRFMGSLEYRNGTWHYPAHLKFPKIAQADVQNQRGWLDLSNFKKLPLVKKDLLAPNTYHFVFALPSPSAILGLPIGQHVSIRGMVDGKFVSRSYTPISNNTDRGVLELVVRCYPDGLFTNGYLRQLEVGDEVEFRGPKGSIRYQPGMCEKIGMVAGGTGITPMYQLIRAICENQRDTTEISLIYANRSEQDILLHDELDNFARKYPRNFKVFYVLDQAPVGWNGGCGFVNRGMMEGRFAAPSSKSKIFLCGPPPMVDSVKKSLRTLGYKVPGAISKPSDDIFCF